jgi:murein L,D-transpeptidase YcbB/YkuD
MNFFRHFRLLRFIVIASFVSSLGSSNNSVRLIRCETLFERSAPETVLQHVSPGAEAALSGWIDAGNLPDLRWPNFDDYRAHVKRFYQAAAYALAWTSNGQPTPQALLMINVFQQADGKGLHSEDYDGSRWAGRIERRRPSNPSLSDTDLARFDLALTVCAMRYISDLHIGKVNPRTFHFGLDIEGKKYDLPDFLRQQLVSADARNAQTVLAEVEPPFGGYRRTQQALQVYENLARQDDGEQLPAVTSPAKPGDRYSGVPRLVRLLRSVGDLPPDSPIPADKQVYTAVLAEAVKRFQIRHGLDVNGYLNAATIKQLNVPLARRVEQLRLTLERWRWVPHEFARPPVVVNIPEFRLRALNEQYRTTLAMNVVVGRAYRHQAGLRERYEAGRVPALLECALEHPAG